MSLQTVFESTALANQKAILEFLIPQPGSKLLDCGCADGTFTLEVAHQLKAGETFGVEYVPELAEICRQKGVRVSTKNLNEGLDYPSDYFDVVLSNQVIEHLVETDLYVREVLRVLKPGGCTIQSTNNMASWHNILSLVLGMQPMPCHASNEIARVGNHLGQNRIKGSRRLARGRVHWRVLAYAALGELFEYHGFCRVHVKTSGYYPFPPALASFLCKIDKWHGAYLIMKAYKPLER